MSRAINDRDMTRYEYEKAKKRLGPQTQIMKSLKSDSLDYIKQLQKYLEILITVKGHAWCMDVANERRKMAKMITIATMPLLTNRP